MLYIDELKKDENEWVKYDPTSKLDHSLDEDILLEGGEKKHRSNDHKREESSIEKEQETARN